jgi:hypothetical protein
MTSPYVPTDWSPGQYVTEPLLEKIEGGLEAVTDAVIALEAGGVGPGTDVTEVAGISVFARTYLDDADAAATRTTLGVPAAASGAHTGTTTAVNLVVSSTITVPDASLTTAKVSGLAAAIAAATTTSTGTVELATTGETTTGSDTTRAVTPAGVAAAIATVTPASIGAEPEFTGDPIEGAVLAHDGADPIWVVPEAVTAADIPYSDTDVAAALAELFARVNAIETTGPTLTNSVLPAITGTSEVGETVTVSNGTWSQTPDSYTYQWKRSGANISGETTSTYDLDIADVGTGTITCTVTAIKSGFTNGAATTNPLTVTVAADAAVATFVTAYADSATSLTISQPSGLANGDWLVAILRSTLSIGSTDWVSSSGGTWNRIGPAWPGASGAARVVGFYVRKVTDAGSEPASYTFNHNGAAGRRVGVLLVLRGLDGTTPTDVAVTDYYGTTITNGKQTASLTVTQNDCLQIFAGTSDFSTMTEVPTTVPSGFTLITTAKTSATAPSSRTYLWIASRDVDAGATGTSDIAWSAGAIDPVAQSIVFAPA